MTQPQSLGAVEEVEIQGHIIDSLILPKVLDEILTHGGSFNLKDIRIGQHQADPSYVRIEVRAPTQPVLEEILDVIHDHGAVPPLLKTAPSCPQTWTAPFPKTFTAPPII